MLSEEFAGKVYDISINATKLSAKEMMAALTILKKQIEKKQFEKLYTGEQELSDFNKSKEISTSAKLILNKDDIKNYRKEFLEAGIDFSIVTNSKDNNLEENTIFFRYKDASIVQYVLDKLLPSESEKKELSLTTKEMMKDFVSKDKKNEPKVKSEDIQYDINIYKESLEKAGIKYEIRNGKQENEFRFVFSVEDEKKAMNCLDEIIKKPLKEIIEKAEIKAFEHNKSLDKSKRKAKKQDVLKSKQ